MSKYKIRDLAVEVSQRIDNPKTSGYDKFVGLEHYDSGEAIMSRYGRTDNLDSSVKEFKSGDILIARRNVYLRRAGLVNFDGVTSGDSIVIRANDAIIQRLLPFVFNTKEFWDFANQFADGSMSKRLSPKLLMEYETELPDSDENRIKLADLLWSVFDTMTSYKELLRQSDELIKSRFIEMFDNYDKVDLSTLADITMGQSPDSKSYNDDGNGMPFFQGKGDYGDKIAIVAHWTTAPSKIVDGNVVLMSVRAPVGPVNFSPVKCCIGRGLCGINAKAGKTNNEFLYNALNVMQDEIAGKGVGSTFAAITKKDVYEIQIPNAPIELCDEFSAFAQQIDKSILILQDNIAKLEAVYKKIMSKYLKKED